MRTSCISRLGACAVFVMFLCVARAPSAHAGGLEYNGAGTESAGRGGAFAARADTPMALQLNPAMLSDLPGIQIMVDVNVGLFDACFARAGTYQDGGGPPPAHVPSYPPSGLGAYDPTLARFPAGWENTPFPRVCNETPFSPGTSIVASWQITPDVGIGIGLLTPYAAGATRYGTDAGYTDAAMGLPSPGRYVLVSQNLLNVFPSVGLGWRATPWLRLGATFQWGLASIDDRIISASLAGEDAASDVYTKLNVFQAFQPAGIFSIALRPIYEGQHRLDIMGSFRVVAPIDADGDLTLSGNEFNADPALRPGADARNTTVVHHVHLHAPQPYTAQFGIRYGLRRGSELETQLDRSHHHDALATEVFDVEVDGVYEINSLVNDFTVTLPTDPLMRQFYDPALGAPAPLPQTVLLPHHWRDQVSLRVGGDWNVIRDMLAVRAGFSWESQGMSTPMAQLDFINGQRFQLHLGATFRIDDVDISAAYMHIFQSDINSTTDGIFQQNSASGAGAIVNRGVISASWNVFSLGVTAHFR